LKISQIGKRSLNLKPWEQRKNRTVDSSLYRGNLTTHYNLSSVL